MLRSLMILGVLSVVAFAAGWFTIHRDGERTTIEINRGEIRDDTLQAVDRGREYWEQRRLQEAQVQNSYGTAQSQYPQHDQAAPNAPYGGYPQPASYNQPLPYQAPTNQTPTSSADPWGNNPYYQPR